MTNTNIQYSVVDWLNNPKLLTDKIASILTKAYEYCKHNNIAPDLTPELIKYYVDIFTDGHSLNTVWIAAFTHASVNIDVNYETMEFLGDNIIDGVAVEYLYVLFGGKLNQETGTLLKVKYVSKEPMAKFSRQLNLGDYVIINRQDLPTLPIDIQEDSFESFFGAINLIGNDRLGFGQGYKHCYYLISYVFRDIDFGTIEDIQKDAKSKLKELYEKMGWGTVYYLDETSDRPDYGKRKISVYIRDQNRLLAIAYANNKATAELLASEKALAQLEKEGITAATADKQREQKILLASPELQKQNKRAEQALQILNGIRAKRGLTPYTKMYLERKATNTVAGTRYTIFLKLATLENGKETWYTVGNETNYDDVTAKIGVLRNFADTQGIPR